MTRHPTHRTRCTPGRGAGVASALPGRALRGVVLTVLFLATACAQRPAQPTLPLAALLPADAVLLGEQHDAPDHQNLAYQAVQALHAQPGLAALVLEMAEAGHSTQGVSPQATPEQVRAALQWSPAAWPWATYEPVVMAAVRAGVPVLGANLPRERMRAAMADPTLDTTLPAAALERQREAVRDGHCGLLPPGQIAPMTRVQVARDRAMAQTLAAAAQPGRTVVLLAGSAHVDAETGIPRHLPPGLRAQPVTWAPQPPRKDYCAQLREQMKSRTGPG